MGALLVEGAHPPHQKAPRLELHPKIPDGASREREARPPVVEVAQRYK